MMDPVYQIWFIPQIFSKCHVRRNTRCIVTGRGIKSESEKAHKEVIPELIPEQVSVMEALERCFSRACAQSHPSEWRHWFLRLIISPVTIEQKSLLSPKALLSICTLGPVYSSLIIVTPIIKPSLCLNVSFRLLGKGVCLPYQHLFRPYTLQSGFHLLCNCQSHSQSHRGSHLVRSHRLLPGSEQHSM